MIQQPQQRQPWRQPLSIKGIFLIFITILGFISSRLAYQCQLMLDCSREIFKKILSIVAFLHLSLLHISPHSTSSLLCNLLSFDDLFLIS